MAYFRTLKSGEQRLLYTAKDKHIQAERRQLHGLNFRKPFSFDAKTIKANVEYCFRSAYPYSVIVREWMADLLSSQATLRARIHNTLRWQATGEFVEPVWLSGNPNDARAVLYDVQERIRMIRQVGKKLGVEFYDQSNNTKRGS